MLSAKGSKARGLLPGAASNTSTLRGDKGKTLTPRSSNYTRAASRTTPQYIRRSRSCCLRSIIPFTDAGGDCFLPGRQARRAARRRDCRVLSTS